jgi:hypothetical protein
MRATLTAAVAGLLLAIAAFFYGLRLGQEREAAVCAAGKAAEAARQAEVNHQETERQRREAEDLAARESERQAIREELLHVPPDLAPARACLDADRVRQLGRIR